MHARLLLVLAVLGTATAAGCGGDDDGGPAPATTTAARSATIVVRGYQFTATLPSAWTDVSNQITQDVTQYDAAYGDRTATGFKPTVLVIRERTAEIREQPIEETVAGIREATNDPAGSTTEPGESTRIGGATALQDVTSGRQGGQAVVKRQFYVKHDGSLYTVAFTAADGDAKAEGTLRSLLASWRWTGGNDTNPDAPAGSG